METKITVGGSMAFAKEQIEVKKKLEDIGFKVSVTDDIESYADSPSIKQSFEEELKISLEYDIMRSFFRKIQDCDIFLVCNYDKKGIKGYLGTSVLMEMGLAYHLNKRICLLHEYDKSQGYALEVAIINPQILNGNLSRIEKVSILRET